jgi:zinc D-Ala-D-Ala carboxypeptidase
VESRMLDVQARFARLSGGAPVAVTAAPTAAAPAAPAASFEKIVAAARLSASSASPTMTTIATATGGTPTLPSGLRGLTNGKLPDNALAPIGLGQHRLEKSAAAAFRRMAIAAAEDGVTFDVSDSYRTVAEQEQTAATVGLYREGGLAAVPGTSTHGWGLSVDFELNARAQNWLRANAARFGFSEDVPREPWHYTYRPADI